MPRPKNIRHRSPKKRVRDARQWVRSVVAPKPVVVQPAAQSATAARVCAVKAITAVLTGSGKPREIIDKLGGDLDGRDRSFLMEIVYGVLRSRDLLDWTLSRFLPRIFRLSPPTLNNLRSAVYQIRFMRVPEWAAVNEAVTIEKVRGGKPDLVNAVLRNVLRRADELVYPESRTMEYISVTTSHPAWMIRRWIRRFGYDEALHMARANNEVPPLTVRIDDAKDRQQALRIFAERGLTASAGRWIPPAIVVGEGTTFQDLLDMLPFPFIVQDEAAQLVSFLLDPSPGQRVLDLCAAPGGKTTHIASLMGHRGEIIAVDADGARLERLRENLLRLGVGSVNIVQGDAADLGAVLEKADMAVQDAERARFDRILIDAPCSSTGVIRRNPDVRYRLAAKDLQRHGENQLRILQAAAPFLKTGGSMVYSVCSTEPEEGEGVVGEFLKRNGGYHLAEGSQSFLEPFRETNGKGCVWYRTWPHRHGMDGFFVALIVRDSPISPHETIP